MDSMNEEIHSSKENRTQFHEHLLSLVEPQMISVEKPMVELPYVEYTEAERNVLREMLVGTVNEGEEVPTHHVFTVEPVKLKIPNEPGVNPHTLKTVGPPWALKCMRPAFSKFNTDSNVYSKEIRYGEEKKRVELTYPIIRSCRQRRKNGDTRPPLDLIYIEFSKLSNGASANVDAAVALKMRRQYKIRNPDNKDEVYNLIFDYVRDSNSQPRVKGYGERAMFGTSEDTSNVHTAPSTAKKALKPALKKAPIFRRRRR
jgi:hypothetical protein